MVEIFGSELIYTLTIVVVVLATFGIVMALALAGMIMKPSGKKRRRRTKNPPDAL